LGLFPFEQADQADPHHPSLLPIKMRRTNPLLLIHHPLVLVPLDPLVPYLPQHLLHPTETVLPRRSLLLPGHRAQLPTQLYPKDQDSKPKVWVHQKLLRQMKNAPQLALGDSDHLSLIPCPSGDLHRQLRVPPQVPVERRDHLWLLLLLLVRRRKMMLDLNHHLFLHLARVHPVRRGEVIVSNHVLLSVLAEITEKGIGEVVMIDVKILELLLPTPRLKRREVIRIGRNRRIYFKLDTTSWQEVKRGDLQVREKRRKQRKKERIEKLEKKRRRQLKKRMRPVEKGRGMKL
jgi:hypothetical protein